MAVYYTALWLPQVAHISLDHNAGQLKRVFVVPLWKERKWACPWRINSITSLAPSCASGESQWKNRGEKAILVYLTLMLCELVSCQAPILLWTAMLSFTENHSADRKDLIKLLRHYLSLSSSAFFLFSISPLSIWNQALLIFLISVPRLEWNNFIKGQWTVVQFSHTQPYLAEYMKVLPDINSSTVWFLF